MADEYNELEQLVNDVTSIDTARMTLRWALERLNGIEKERAELKKNLGMAEGDRKQLESRVRELEESFRSRSKTLDEKEGFYSKLEATMSLLGEGKLDLQQLLRKENRLDQLRSALEDEYQAKFEELDRKQKGVIERWNQRLLDVETQYAARLSEAQAKYDSLRSEVDSEHQSRLTALEKNYKSKEAELKSRIEMLEKSVRGSEGGIEARRKELESEFLSKKNEVDGNFRRLRAELETSFDARIRSVDTEHAQQLRSLESTWAVERARLTDEQRVREDQFRNAQEKIRELENSMASVQERTSEEVMRQLAKKDEFFRARVAEMESAAAAFAAREAELASSYETALGRKAAELDSRYAADRDALKAALEAERFKAYELEKKLSLSGEERSAEAMRLIREKEDFFSRSLAEMEALRAKDRSEYEAREAELKERFGREKAAQAEALTAEQSELKSALEAEKVRTGELGAKLAAAGDELNAEVMRRIKEKEELFNKALAEAEASRARERAASEARAKESESLADKRFADMSAAAARRAGELESMVRSMQAELAAEKQKSLSAAADAVKAREGEFEKALADQRSMLSAEKERLEGLLSGAEKSAEASRAEVRSLLEANRRAGEELIAAESRFSRELGEVRAAAEKEAQARVEEAVGVRTAALAGALEDLKSVKGALEDKVSRLENDLAEARDAAARTEREYRARHAFEDSSALSEKVAELESRYDARRAELEDETAQLRAALEAEYSRKSGQSEKTVEVRLAQLHEENEALRASISSLRGEAAASGTRAAKVFDELMQKVREHKEETLSLRESHAAELDARTRAAVEKVTEGLVRKIAMAEEEIASMRDDYELELARSREASAAEKDRLLAELGKREKYAEAAGLKIADLERQLIAHRQEAAETVVRQLAGQEEKFKDVIAEFQKRQLELEEGYFRQVGQTRKDYEERLARLEELAASKDRTLKEREAVYGRKQLELDARQGELSIRAAAIDQEIGEMRRADAARERDLESRRLELDKEYARKSAELEKMRMELSRAIAEYKGKK
ncbi:MAG: hypothetical protein FD189_769 [Elusimicrobia bacterium]|nr:MAG: hypothetical protein FD154_700 [Elusimicrobiota bacterium]KAF0157015.1 MAG: hypothetical protein FD189_769 [Elusimicrobiota bacterium]